MSSSSSCVGYLSPRLQTRGSPRPLSRMVLVLIRKWLVWVAVPVTALAEATRGVLLSLLAMGICRFLPSLAPQATLPNFELLRQLSVRRRPLHRSILTLATSDPSPPFVPTAPPFQNVSAEGSSNLPPAPRSHPESRLSYICPLPPSLPTVEETSEVPTASESPSVPNTIPPFSASSFTTGPSIPNASSSPVPAAIHSNSVMNTPVSSLPTSRTPEGRHRSHHSHDGFHVFAEHALKRFHSITHRPSLHLKPKVKRAKSFSDATGSVRSVRPTDREIGATVARSDSKKRVKMVERTDPYAAPFFFPTPVAPDAEDYIERARYERRERAGDERTEGVCRQESVASGLGVSSSEKGYSGRRWFGHRRTRSSI